MNLKLDEVLSAWVYLLVTVLIVSVAAQLYLQYGQAEAITLLLVGYVLGTLLQYRECVQKHSHLFSCRQSIMISLLNPLIMLLVVVAGTVFFVFLRNEDSVESAVARLQNIV